MSDMPTGRRQRSPQMRGFLGGQPLERHRWRGCPDEARARGISGRAVSSAGGESGAAGRAILPAGSYRNAVFDPKGFCCSRQTGAFTSHCSDLLQRVCRSDRNHFTDSCACRLFPPVRFCISLPVERPENSIVTDTDLLQLRCRLSDSPGNAFGGGTGHHKDQIIIYIFVRCSPPSRRFPQQGFQPLLQNHKNRNVQSQPLPYPIPDCVCKSDLILFVNGKDSIPAVKVCTNVCIAEFFQPRFQLRHGDSVFAADVDTSQQSNVSFHAVSHIRSDSRQSGKRSAIRAGKCPKKCEILRAYAIRLTPRSLGSGVLLKVKMRIPLNRCAHKETGDKAGYHAARPVISFTPYTDTRRRDSSRPGRFGAARKRSRAGSPVPAAPAQCAQAPPRSQGICRGTAGSRC